MYGVLLTERSEIAVYQADNVVGPSKMLFNVVAIGRDQALQLSVTLFYDLIGLAK